MVSLIHFIHFIHYQNKRLLIHWNNAVGNSLQGDWMLVIRVLYGEEYPIWSQCFLPPWGIWFLRLRPFTIVYPHASLCWFPPTSICLFIYYWNIIALHRCVSFCCTTEVYLDTHIPPSWASLPPLIPAHPTHLGHHRALSWAELPCLTPTAFKSTQVH